jgi:hypothetical protein
MRVGLLAIACTACTAMQSARTLAPGKTEVTVGLGRMSYEGDIDRGLWSGHAMLRRGIVDGFDLGVHLEHTPGGGGVGAFAIDPKVRLASSGRTTLGAGIPLGILWSDDIELRFRGVMALPSLYLSLEISPYVDLVSNVRYMASRGRTTETGAFGTMTGFGASIGARFVDDTHTWAVQPEAGMTRVEESTYLTLGLTIAVGN